MTLTGTSGGSTTTDGSGNYSFSGLFGGGSFTVTPSKAARAPGSSGINTSDVVAAQRHFLQILPLLTGCRLTSADVNSDLQVNTTDVIAIQRFFLALTSGIAGTGQYRFSPVNRPYSPLTSNQTGQNYDAVVLGDAAAPFANPRPGGPGGDAPIASTVEAVTLPELDQTQGKIVAEVKATQIDASSNLVGFQGDLQFDERVITFDDQPIQNAGLTAGNWNVSANVLPGNGPIKTLRISAFSNDFLPLSGSGTLFALKMTRVSKAAQSAQLRWAEPPDQFVFIDADSRMHTVGNDINR